MYIVRSKDQTEGRLVKPYIQIHMFGAGYGDAFLVSCVSEKKKINLLIDGGFYYTYDNEIRAVLQDMRKKGEKLDLFVITHIDADHIGGAIGLIAENGNANKPNIIQIDQVWHNSFRHLTESEIGDQSLEGANKKVLLDIIKQNQSTLEQENSKANKAPISPKQGSTLAALLLAGEYNWNKYPISLESSPNVHISEDVHLTILSPTKAKLELLRNKWHRKLCSYGFSGKLKQNPLFDDAVEYLSLVEERQGRGKGKRPMGSSVKNWEGYKEEDFEEDKNPINGSSIAFELEYAGKHVLFLGDSHPSVIIESLKSLPKYNVHPYLFDAIKISHHGSKGNTNPDLLKFLDSRRYLISTNGSRYNHPDHATLINLVDREEHLHRTLFFNYETEASKYMKEQLEKQRELCFEVIHDREVKIL